jgi:hypothetical protein
MSVDDKLSQTGAKKYQLPGVSSPFQSEATKVSLAPNEGSG